MTRIITLCMLVALGTQAVSDAQVRIEYQAAASHAPPAKAQLKDDEAAPDIFKSLTSILITAASPETVAPRDQSTMLFHDFGATDERDWAETEFNWAATDFYHRPLYFEYIPLERYGQSTHRWVQPWLCGAHFFGTFPILAYKMGVERPRDRIYALGYYRPGSYAPRQRQHLPWERRGAFYEASFWVTMAFAFP